MRRPITVCPLACPMLNAYGFCESAMRRVEQVRACPHRELRKKVSKQNTQK